MPTGQASAIRRRGWRWLRDFAARRLEAEGRRPWLRAEGVVGTVLIALVNRAFGGSVVVMAAGRKRWAHPVPETIRQSLLVNLIDIAVYTTDRDGAVTLFNDAAVAFWGQRPVIGDARWCGAYKLYTADGEFLPHDRCPMAVALREQRPIRGVEAIAERPDGTRVPFIPHPTPIFDEKGVCVGAVNVLVDITERKEAEKRRLLLTREVDHRAKNLLAVVRSLVRMTKHDDPRRFAEALDGRLAALANAHTLLAADGWQGAELHAVAERELAAYPGRAVFLGPVARLAPAAVQPVAMLLHELATNACKHGALSAPNGRVHLTWEQEEDGGLRLHWRESGGPKVREPERKGFGSRMIGSLARQLQGEVAKDWRPDGLRCTATVAAALVSPGAAAAARRAAA